MIKVIQTTKHYSLKEFDLHYYHDAVVSNGSGKLYDDNGETSQAFEKGASALLSFHSVFDKNMLSIVMSEKHGMAYHAMDRNVTLFIHNVSTKPQQVLAQNKAQPFDWDEKQHLLKIVVPWSKKSNEKVAVKFSR